MDSQPKCGMLAGRSPPGVCLWLCRLLPLAWACAETAFQNSEAVFGQDYLGSFIWINNLYVMHCAFLCCTLSLGLGCLKAQLQGQSQAKPDSVHSYIQLAVDNFIVYREVRSPANDDILRTDINKLHAWLTDQTSGK